MPLLLSGSQQLTSLSAQESGVSPGVILTAETTQETPGLHPDFVLILPNKLNIYFLLKWVPVLSSLWGKKKKKRNFAES